MSRPWRRLPTSTWTRMREAPSYGRYTPADESPSRARRCPVLVRRHCGRRRSGRVRPDRRWLERRGLSGGVHRDRARGPICPTACRSRSSWCSPRPRSQTRRQATPGLPPQVAQSQHNVIVAARAAGIPLRVHQTFHNALNGFSAFVPRVDIGRLPSIAGVAGGLPGAPRVPGRGRRELARRARLRRAPAGTRPRRHRQGRLRCAARRAARHLASVPGRRDALTPWNAVTDEPREDDPTADAARHATYMAGIIAGAGGPAGLGGVAPGAKILPIQVMAMDRGVLVGIDVLAARGHRSRARPERRRRPLRPRAGDRGARLRAVRRVRRHARGARGRRCRPRGRPRHRRRRQRRADRRALRHRRRRPPPPPRGSPSARPTADRRCRPSASRSAPVVRRSRCRPFRLRACWRRSRTRRSRRRHRGTDAVRSLPRRGWSVRERRRAGRLPVCRPARAS